MNDAREEIKQESYWTENLYTRNWRRVCVGEETNPPAMDEGWRERSVNTILKFKGPRVSTATITQSGRLVDHPGRPSTTQRLDQETRRAKEEPDTR